MRKYPAVEAGEAARVLARHSRMAEEDVLKGGRAAVRRAVREAKGSNLEAERERLSRELSEAEDELRALEAAADALLAR